MPPKQKKPDPKVQQDLLDKIEGRTSGGGGSSSSAGPKPPRVPANKPAGAPLQFHGDTLQRPFEWLKNYDSDPDVGRYLRSEAQYCFTMQKQRMTKIVDNLLDEAEKREPGSDAGLPDAYNGYWWWSEDGDEEDDHTNDAVNKQNASVGVAAAAAAERRNPEQQQSSGAMAKKHGKSDMSSNHNKRKKFLPSAPTANFSLRSASRLTDAEVRALNAIGHTENDKSIYYRAKYDPSKFVQDSDDYFMHSARYFSRDYFADDLSHPPGTEAYVDLNDFARKYNLKNAEQEDEAFSPSSGRVAMAVDTTAGSEDMSIVVWDIASKKQLAVVGPVAYLAAHDMQQKEERQTKTAPAAASSSSSSSSLSSSDHGIIITQIQSCAGHVIFLDENTIAFVEVSTQNGHTCRVWALFIGSAADLPAAAAAATDDAPSPSFSSSSRLNLLYEEKNVDFEICGLYSVTSEQYILINTMHSKCYESILVPSPLRAAQIKEEAVARHDSDALAKMRDRANSAPMQRYVTKTFRQRREGEQFSMEHDPRPLSFFLGQQKEKQEKQHESASRGGTWFITNNFMTDDREMSIFICSGDDDTNDTSRWHPFLVVPNIVCSGGGESTEAADANDATGDEYELHEEKKKNAAIQALRDCVVLDEVTCYRDFLTVSVVVGGMQNVLLLDLVAAVDKNNNSSSNSSSSRSDSASPPFSTPLKLSDFIDVRSLLQQDPLFGGREGTFVDASSAWLDYDTPHLLVEVSNPVVPLATFMIERFSEEFKLKVMAIKEVQSTEENKDNDRKKPAGGKKSTKKSDGVTAAAAADSQEQQNQQPLLPFQQRGWTARCLLAEKFKGYDAAKYTVQMQFVEALSQPETWKSPTNSRAASQDYDENSSPTKKSGNGGDDDAGPAAGRTQQQQQQQQPCSPGEEQTCMIPLLLVYRTDKIKMKSNAKNRALLETYSSYGDTHDVGFSNTFVSLLDRGIIFANAMCRGSGEFGQKWHFGGSGLKRKNTIHDFIACAAHLKSHNFCDRICCRGESAGGTIVGAAVNIRPDLFCSCIARVPFVDVLGTMLVDTGAMTRSERNDWGDPRENATVYELLKSYSPCENVPADPAVLMPSIWVESNIHDKRVSYAEPAIWVATLRQRWLGASSSADRVVLHKVNFEGGHDGDTLVDDDVQEANEFGFACWSLGVFK